MELNQEQVTESAAEPVQELENAVETRSQGEPEKEYNTFEDSPEVKSILDSLTAVDPDKEEKEKLTEEAVKGPKTPEQEDNEVMESLSERGRERFRSILHDRQQLKEEVTSVKQQIESVQQLVQDSGATPEEFAYLLEAVRLMKSPSEADRRYALERVESIRADMAMQLGIAAPGIDPLADFPDLRQAVEKFDITEEHALELAKLQRADQARQKQEAAQRSQLQQTQEYQQQVAQVAKAADAYFATRTGEADYPAKMKQIQAYFSDPARKQHFVQTFEPRQWFSQLQFMYDNIAVSQPQSQKQPIRSRPSNSGNPSTMGMDDSQRIMSLIDEMGL